MTEVHDFIYLIENPVRNWYKVGRTAQTPEARFREHQSNWNALQLSEEEGYEADTAYLIAYMPNAGLESHLLWRLRPFKLRPENLGSLSPRSREYFEMVPEVLNTFLSSGPIHCAALDLNDTWRAWGAAHLVGGYQLQCAERYSVVHAKAERDMLEGNGAEWLSEEKAWYADWRSPAVYQKRGRART